MIPELFIMFTGLIVVIAEISCDLAIRGELDVGL